MRKGVSKKKFCISIDNDIYEKLNEECIEVDAKLSTRINSILKKYIEEKEENSSIKKKQKK